MGGGRKRKGGSEEGPVEGENEEEAGGRDFESIVDCFKMQHP